MHSSMAQIQMKSSFPNERVTSPGGTTQAAVERLDQAHVRDLVIAAEADDRIPKGERQHNGQQSRDQGGPGGLHGRSPGKRDLGSGPANVRGEKGRTQMSAEG